MREVWMVGVFLAVVLLLFFAYAEPLQTPSQTQEKEYTLEDAWIDPNVIEHCGCKFETVKRCID